MKSHPDRCAATLANVAAARAVQGEGPYALPGPGARDCRIDLKLLEWRALQACAHHHAARERLEAFDAVQRPDLWAGTVQDGVARGFAAALEEAIALVPAAPLPPAGPEDPLHPDEIVVGKDLRRRKDLLVRSSGPRVRFSRKEGLLFVDRERGLHAANCLRFEARADHGTLDAYRPDESERPRLFSAQFLTPQRYVTGTDHASLLLAGRLGRTAAGWNCTVELNARGSGHAVRLAIRIENRQRDQRLRARFLGLPRSAIAHECVDVSEVVQNDAGGFVAFTLVRAVDRLQVDDRMVPVPGALCQGWIEHVFWLGGVGGMAPSR